MGFDNDDRADAEYESLSEADYNREMQLREDERELTLEQQLDRADHLRKEEQSRTHKG